MKSFKKGFTLVELMIVITVIAILATIAVVSFSRVQKQARDTKRKGDLRALATALQAYFTEKNTYPGSDIAGLSTALVPTYIPMMPNNNTGDVMYTTGVAGNGYSYGVNQTVNTFGLCIDMEATGNAAGSYWNVTSSNTGGFLSTGCTGAQ